MNFKKNIGLVSLFQKTPKICYGEDKKGDGCLEMLKKLKRK